MAQNADIASGIGKSGKSGKSVLSARFSAIGDVALTIPVLYSVCRNHPDITFVMVTRPRLMGIFVMPPQNLVVVAADIDEQYHNPVGLKRLCTLLAERHNVGCFIDLHNVLRTKVMRLLFRLRGIPTRHLHKPRAERRKLTRTAGKVMMPVTIQSDLYAAVFSDAGFNTAAQFHGLYGSAGRAAPTDFADITAPKPAGIRWIGIAPFAAHEGKIYPLDKMHKVIESLSQHEDFHVFLFGGGEKERDVFRRWTSEFPRLTSLAEQRHGFAVELALMNHLDMMLSMDSANMHLAALAGIPTLSIWGATHPYCGFTPWQQPEEYIIQAPVDCRPCSVYGNKPCRRHDMLCLNAIAPELVVNRILETLSKNSKQ